MKEEWKVYIKGVPNRGNEVVKALTDLGAKEPFYTGSYTNENFIFFINHKGEIDYEYLDTEQGQIIMDNYREIKLQERWKDGDILVHTDDDGFKVYVVYKFNDYTGFNSIRTYVSVDSYVYGENMVWDRVRCKLASGKEIKQFHKLLHKYGKHWDAEKKQLMDWKWIPEMSNKFYFINIDGKVNVGIHNKETDNIMFNFGNCFKTREEAETASNKIKEVLNNR